MSELEANTEAGARRRRAAEHSPERLVLLTDTGKRLCCSVAAVGRDREPHWMIVDADGALYVGPTTAASPSAGSPHDVIASWWRTQSTSQ